MGEAAPSMDMPKSKVVDKTFPSSQLPPATRPAEVPDVISDGVTSPWTHLDVTKILADQLLALSLRIEHLLTDIVSEINLSTKDCESLRARLLVENMSMYDYQSNHTRPGLSTRCRNSEGIKACARHTGGATNNISFTY